MSDVGLYQEPSSDPPTGQIDREKATLTLFLSLPPSLAHSLTLPFASSVLPDRQGLYAPDSRGTATLCRFRSACVPHGVE